MDIQQITKQLNPEQQKAVLSTDGPVLILAGAGSGKTRVLVHRIAWLLDGIGVSPAQILAITFTNKAADEMRRRVDDMIGFGSEQIHVSTFHSLCVRILRREAELLGYTRYFSIYDTDDQKTLMKNLMKEKNIDTSRFNAKGILNRISSAKNELITPEKFSLLNKDFYGERVSMLYSAYQEKLRGSNAMDFDDLIMKTVEVFEAYPDVLNIYQERFRYIMVDEYQDTNTAQFRLVSMLAAKYRNLCVVGDDDQSIYKFRGANIRNILDFEKVFPSAEVIRLEQNYRSTKQILNTANEVIRHNHGRKDKKLWTDNGNGDKVRLRRFANGFEEAEYVCGEIRSQVRSGKRSYRDFAVLYRTNAQSRMFEEKCLLANIPYRIVGGINFYSRKEIKDLLAYLKTIDNGYDDLMAERIINIPKRGIGPGTLAKLRDYAEAGGISLFEAACAAAEVPGLGSGPSKKVTGFTDFIGVLRAYAETGSVSGILKKVIEMTGYVEELKKEGTDESKGRIENIDELISKAVQYEQHTEQPSLSGFLEDVALIADIDSVEDSDDRILLMTLHSAKGLEFPCVFMTGMEDGLFPSSMSISADDPEDEIEEERRLAYVGITRAKEELTFTCAKERMVRGDIVSSPLSRFIREIPREMVDAGFENESPSARSRFGAAEKRSGFGGSPGFGKSAEERFGFGGGTGFGKSADEQFGFGSSTGFGKSAEEEFGFGGTSAGKGNRNNESPVSSRRKNEYASPYKAASKAAASINKTPPDYSVGDTVRHTKFGTGTVLEMRDGGKDYLVTVDFRNWGVKKLYASFAKLTREQ